MVLPHNSASRRDASAGDMALAHLRPYVEAEERSVGGADVHTQILPGVRGYFFVKQESTPAEDAMTLKVPTLILQARDRLAQSENNRPEKERKQ